MFQPYPLPTHFMAVPVNKIDISFYSVLLVGLHCLIYLGFVHDLYRKGLMQLYSYLQRRSEAGRKRNEDERGRLVSSSEAE